VQLIQANSSKDDYIFSLHSEAALFTFSPSEENPTRFLWWRSVGISSEDAMRDDDDRQPPGKAHRCPGCRRQQGDPGFIGDNYDPVGTVADIAVYGLRKPANDAAKNQPPSIDTSGPSRSGKETLVQALTAAGMLAVAVGVYALLFNRANVLSHSIGYNLYASERVLNGDVPYRDFHTLYPPRYSI